MTHEEIEFYIAIQDENLKNFKEQLTLLALKTAQLDKRLDEIQDTIAISRVQFSSGFWP
jgi:hypothetical protein